MARALRVPVPRPLVVARLRWPAGNLPLALRTQSHLWGWPWTLARHVSRAGGRPGDTDLPCCLAAADGRQAGHPQPWLSCWVDRASGRFGTSCPQHWGPRPPCQNGSQIQAIVRWGVPVARGLWLTGQVRIPFWSLGF